MKNNRDIIVLIIAVLVIVACGYFVYVLLFPTQKAPVTQNSVQTENKYINTNVDTNTYSGIEKLSSYPKANLTNIGKTDLFANN
jgi:flagellar basal body-associated protein FliL